MQLNYQWNSVKLHTSEEKLGTFIAIQLTQLFIKKRNNLNKTSNRNLMLTTAKHYSKNLLLNRNVQWLLSLAYLFF